MPPEQGDIEMQRIIRGPLAVLGLGAGLIGGALPAAAGSDDGKFQIRVLGTVVDPDTDATVKAGGATIPGADADVSTEVIPALTLGYYFTPNLAVELFCCFAKHEIDGKGTHRQSRRDRRYLDLPAGAHAAISLHRSGHLEPYVGAGVQYINFFDTGTGDNMLGAAKVDIDDAWGFTLQAGVDVGLGNGWSLNLDVKKTWLDTTVTWHNNDALGGVNVVGDADIDPWIFSAGLGYRFNLGRFRP